MVPITIDNLNFLDIELTNWCNADCPMCARTNDDGTPASELINNSHLTLDLLDRQIGSKIFSQVNTIGFVGSLGDATMNPECLEVMQYCRHHNPTALLGIATNGGARSEDFWRALGSIKDMKVTFGIDGLEDTNHLYRRNVVWSKLMRNVKAFIEAGGQAIWQYIVFKHNEHQIEDAKKLSEELGFVAFNQIYSVKWQVRNWVNFTKIERSLVWPVANGTYYLEPPKSQIQSNVNSDSPSFNLDQKIKCEVASDGTYRVMIRANGVVQPCCMLGELSRHQFRDLVDHPNDINLNYHTLEEILQGSFFSRLYNGINGGPERLQTCFFHCGIGESSNRLQYKDSVQ